jgi:hypothetical protein
MKTSVSEIYIFRYTWFILMIKYPTKHKKAIYSAFCETNISVYEIFNYINTLRVKTLIKSK